MLRELDKQDLLWAVRRLPRPVVALLKKRGPNVFLAGGYLRSIVSGEKINDIDLFAASKEAAEIAALELATEAGLKVYTTANAFSIKMKPFMVQFIHRWPFARPEEAMESFDFTVAQAAIWWGTDAPGGDFRWFGLCSDRFYVDLAAKRLIYTAPQRNEDAGGSLLRVLKFYQRGYRIPLDSLGAVVARLCSGVRQYHEALGEEKAAMLLTGLLHEVDPLIDPDHISHLPATNGTADEEI